MTLFEKRAMAPWPAFELATAFPPAFERAFADRFGGRDILIRVHHASLLEFFGVSALTTVMPGHDGWYYWLGEDGLSLDRHYRGVEPFPQAYVDATAAEFVRRRDWLAARGIAYVVAIVPEKFTIYPEYLPAWVAHVGATDAVRSRGRRAGKIRESRCSTCGPHCALRKRANASITRPTRIGITWAR